MGRWTDGSVPCAGGCGRSVPDTDRICATCERLWEAQDEERQERDDFLLSLPEAWSC